MNARYVRAGGPEEVKKKEEEGLITLMKERAVVRCRQSQKDYYECVKDRTISVVWACRRAGERHERVPCTSTPPTRSSPISNAMGQARQAVHSWCGELSQSSKRRLASSPDPPPRRIHRVRPRPGRHHEQTHGEEPTGCRRFPPRRRLRPRSREASRRRERCRMMQLAHTAAVNPTTTCNSVATHAHAIVTGTRIVCVATQRVEPNGEPRRVDSLSICRSSLSPSSPSPSSPAVAVAASPTRLGGRIAPAMT